MISLVICSRISGNDNFGLPNLLASLEQFSASYNNIEVLVKFDSDDENVEDMVATLSDYPFTIKYLVEPRGRGYVDIHIGYTRLLSLLDPCTTVVGAFADDFIITVQDWDEKVLSKTKAYDDDIYCLHQRPHPPYYRKQYQTEPFYLDFSLEQLDYIEIVDEGPFWSRRWLEICGGLGHVSFTDAWTLCLQWYLYHLYGVNRTQFLDEPVIHRVLNAMIDTSSAQRWHTERASNFDFMQSEHYHVMVMNQASNLHLNIANRCKSMDQFEQANQSPGYPAAARENLLQRLLETAQGALDAKRPEVATREYERIIHLFPDCASAHRALTSLKIAS
ncbi:MAG: hypothetical protein GXP08_04390 [Gammaproteobacteria bacterium]|nr:hypothetical protein [Gammaproteobacteria bacterium]